MHISRRLADAIRCSGERQYRIAHKAHLHPSTLSQLLNGIYPVKPNDPRVLAVGVVLGLSEEECFEAEPATPRHEQQASVN